MVAGRGRGDGFAGVLLVVIDNFNERECSGRFFDAYVKLCGEETFRLFIDTHHELASSFL